MPKAKSSVGTAKPSWWLGAGDEQCAHCGELYVLEVEFRCPDCDGPTCPHCKLMHAEGHFVCPDCAETKADGR